jgi:hypothetical protein
VVGFAILAVSGIALAVGVQTDTYLGVLPGLLLYGVGLAFVLSTNDPVSLDSIPSTEEGQASGVSATAEQGGGAIGIAVLYALFHTAYVNQLHYLIDSGPLANLNDAQYGQLRDGLLAAENTGLHPAQFEPSLVNYLEPASELPATATASRSSPWLPSRSSASPSPPGSFANPSRPDDPALVRWARPS